MKKFGMFLATIALVGTLITACGGSKTSYGTATASGSSSEASATEVASGPTITIANMAFGQPLTVAPGVQDKPRQQRLSRAFRHVGHRGRI